jgi:hypothetical protein
MPVTAIVGCIARHDDDVSLTDTDLVIAARAAVRLDRFVGLDSADLRFALAGIVGELVIGHSTVGLQLPKAAQSTSPTTTTSATATMARSPRCFTVARNGL